MKILLALTVTGFLASSTTQAQPKRYPQFEDYPAPMTFKGKPAPARIVGARAKLFRTVIRNGASQGPNFSGRYTLVMWGCGSSCRQLAIVDALNGTVYIPGGLLQLVTDPWAGVDPLAAEEPVQFKRDSRLLVLVGGGYVGRRPMRMGKYFYEWRRNRLRLVRSIKRHYY